MPLKAAVKALEEVEEGLRPLYKQEGEIFVLETESALGYGNENIEGLKTTVGKLRREKSDLEAKVKLFDGLDPVAAAEAIAKVKEFTELDPEKAADKIAQTKVDAIIGQIKGQYEGQINGHLGLIGKLKTSVTKMGVDAEIDRALTALEAGGDKILPSVRGDLKVVMRQWIKHEIDADGSLKIHVHDGEGNPRVKNTAGDQMNITDLVADLPKSRPSFFEPKGAGGGGTNPNGGGGGTPPPAGQFRSEMSFSDKAAFVAKHGQPAYQALPAARPKA